MTVKCKHPNSEFVDGRRKCLDCGKNVILIGDAVAQKGFSPHEWQKPNPANSLFGSRGGPPVGDSADLDRILALPRRRQVVQGSVTAEAMIELVQDRLSLGPRAKCDCKIHDTVIPDCITRLLWVQAWMLHEISTAAGLIGAVPVGGGKELVGLLAPMMMPNCRIALLLMPASLIDQVAVNWKLASEHFRVPKLVVHAPGGDRSFNRGPGVMPDAPTLHVMAYTRLSSVKSSDWLANLRPDTVIANECFPTGTLVTTDVGQVDIQQVVDGGVGRQVLTAAPDGNLTWKAIISRIKKIRHNRLVRVTHVNGQVTCTEDHEIWTSNRGFVKASSLQTTDELAVRVVQGVVQTHTGDQEMLQPEMQLCGARGEGRGAICNAAGWSSSNRDQDVSALPGTVSGRSVPRHDPLQCEVLQTVYSSCFQNVSDMRDYVHAIKNGDPALFAEMRPKYSKQETAYQAPVRSTGGQVFEVSEGLHHKTQRQDHLTFLQSFLCVHIHPDWSSKARLFNSSEDKPVRMEQEPGNTGSVLGQEQAAESNVSVSGRERSDHVAAGNHPHLYGAPNGTSDCNSTCHRSVTESASEVLGRSCECGDQDCDRDRRQQSRVQEMEVPGLAQNYSIERARVVSVEVLEQGSTDRLESSSGDDYVYDLSVEDNHNYFADGVLVHNCDSIKDLTSARTMRVMRFFAERGDDTRFCGWTGSLTDSSVSEYAHLSLLALRERSPMPMSREAVEEWGRCLDAVPSPAPPGELIRLCAPGESVRQGFRRRLSETEGFVMVGGEQIIAGSGEGGRVHLEICEREAPPLPDIIRQALDFVRRDQRPDTLAKGEWDNSPWPRSEFNKDIEDPMEKSRLLKEVASGMFYRWVFPEGEPEALIKTWFEFRRNYVSQSREIQLRGEVHLDSPKLVEKACMRGWGDLPEDPRLPSLKLDAWPDWRDVMDKVKPKSAAVRLHPYIVDDAATWAREQTGIVWYMMQEFADWIAERHRIPVFGGGMGEAIMKEVGDRSILASVKAHGRGRDRLQYSFFEQIVPQVPSSSRIWEQLLGRLHRRNQKRDVVRTHVYLNTPELRQSYEQALRRASYVEETTGAQQKLTVGWAT